MLTKKTLLYFFTLTQARLLICNEQRGAKESLFVRPYPLMISILSAVSSLMMIGEKWVNAESCRKNASNDA